MIMTTTESSLSLYMLFNIQNQFPQTNRCDTKGLSFTVLNILFQCWRATCPVRSWGPLKSPMSLNRCILSWTINMAIFNYWSDYDDYSLIIFQMLTRNNSQRDDYILPLTSTSNSHHEDIMTSSNGNIFGITGHLCGEFTGHRWIPAQRPVTRSFDVFFDLRLHIRLSKQSWGWWFETPSCPLWRHCNISRATYWQLDKGECFHKNWFRCGQLKGLFKEQLLHKEFHHTSFIRLSLC